MDDPGTRAETETRWTMAEILRSAAFVLMTVAVVASTVATLILS